MENTAQSRKDGSMTKDTKVSVIIPVHNTERYVTKCLDSLLGQTLAEIQVICVNDGSTDRSGEILKEYAGKDNRVCVMEQTNQGQGKARNAAMEIAEGEYCCFVDSDDWLDTKALEHLYAKASEERLDVLYYAGVTEYDTEELARNHSNYFERAYQRDRTAGDVCSGKEMLKRQIEAKQYWRSSCMCLIRSRFLKEAGIRFREGIQYEDNLFSFQLCLRAARVSSAADRYYHRVLRESSIITSKPDSKSLYGYITSITEEIALLEEIAEGYEDKKAFFAVINQTIERAYTVWERPNEEERERIDQYFRAEPYSISEGGLYHSLFLSRFREEEKRRQLIEREKELRQDLTEARKVQGELRKDMQEIYDSSSYRLGHALLTPVRKINKILKGKKGTE